VYNIFFKILTTLYTYTHCTHIHTVHIYTLYTYTHCTRTHTVHIHTLYTYTHCTHIHTVHARTHAHTTHTHTVHIYTLCTYTHCTHIHIVHIYTLYTYTLGWGCEGQWAENLSVRRWMRTGMGWMFRELCRWEVGVRLGWLAMSQRHLDWKTWSLR